MGRRRSWDGGVRRWQGDGVAQGSDVVKGVWLCSNRGVHAGDFAMGHVRGVGEEQLRALFRNAGRARRRVQSAGSCGRVLVGRGSDMMERCFDGTAEGGERRVGRRGVGKMCILSKSGGTHGWVLGWNDDATAIGRPRERHRGRYQSQLNSTRAELS